HTARPPRPARPGPQSGGPSRRRGRYPHPGRRNTRPTGGGSPGGCWGSMGYPSQGRGGASRGSERGNPAAVLDEPDHGGNLGGYRRTGEGGAQAGGGSPAGAASPQGVQNVGTIGKAVRRPRRSSHF